MRRSTLFIIGLALAMLLGSTSAMMYQQNKGPLKESDEAAQLAPEQDAMRQGYVNKGSRHKLILSAEEAATYESLREQNAIVKEIDYGSFKLVVVDELAAGGRDNLMAMSVPVRDDQNLIALNGLILDTTSPDEAYSQIAEDLRQTDMASAVAYGTQPRGGLYLVQFEGPIKDEWLAALASTGAKIVSYMPSNAYVVRATRKAAKRLPALLRQNSFVQFVGDYEPAFRLSPELHVVRKEPQSDPVAITVQVIDGAGAEDAIASLKAMASEFIDSHRVLNYHNVSIRVVSSRLAEIAQMENVFAVEERGTRKKRDEAQGQILAGNLSGNLPVGPGYISWLSSKGFTSSQFSSFAVNVVDDAFSLSGHPDLPSTRIAFQNNPTGQTGAQGGHGFLNAHIVGGFNNGTGAANEDASGFNYGLGIAPYARVGVTAIFGASPASSATWESTAYGQGARISSNSWGFSDANNNPLARYDTNAQSYDRIVRDAQSGVSGNQQMTVVFAAGNDGSLSNTVSSPGTAKNVITVGAGENVRQTGTDGCGIGNTGANSANDVISFSSRGPVNAAGGDGRTKPEIMGPGTHIQAGVPQSNYDGSSVCNPFWPTGQTLYGWSSGTSHSTPAIAGGAALLYQYFLNNSLPAPSPAMAKAFLLNSAARMTGTGANDTLPSNNQGMGRMDLGRAFDDAARMIVDQTQVLGATGQTHQVTGSVDSTSQPFRVTLVWTDAPGPTTGAPWVNNLDLEVTINGVTYRGNVFSGGNSVSGGTADARNNFESVFLPAGTSGSFTVTVRATNIAGDGVPGNADTTDQDFALVIYNANSSAPPPPPPPQQLFINGGFEGSASPWVLSGSAFWTNTGSFPHTGLGYIFLGNANSVSGAAYQQISIPSGAAPSLTFWLNVVSSETTTTTQFDRFFVEVRNTSGTLLATLATFSNLNKGTAGVYVQRGPYSLSSWAGQTVRIQFRATTDSSLITTFRVDDASAQ